MQGEFWEINSEQSLKNAIEHLEKLYAEKRYIRIQWDTTKRRTVTQNNALHLWLGQLSKTLNDAGMDMKKTLKPHVEIPWTMHSAKDHLWRPIQIAITGEESSTEPKRGDYSAIYETICRHLAQSHGITAPEWPIKNG